MKNLKLKYILENFQEIDEDYPLDFSLDKFKEIKKYSDKIKYAKQYLGKPLGVGSSRIVFKVDDTKVLKLARNEKGLAQNSAEIDWRQMDSPILAKIFSFDRDSLWIEMELARKAKLSDFKKIFNINLEELDTYLTIKYDEHRKKEYPFHLDPNAKDILKKLDKIEEMSELVDFMHDSLSPVGDLGRLSSWGVVNRNGKEVLVLVDYGLTEDIYKCYYCVN